MCIYIHTHIREQNRKNGIQIVFFKQFALVHVERELRRDYYTTIKKINDLEFTITLGWLIFPRLSRELRPPNTYVQKTIIIGITGKAYNPRSNTFNHKPRQCANAQAETDNKLRINLVITLITFIQTSFIATPVFSASPISHTIYIQFFSFFFFFVFFFFTFFIILNFLSYRLFSFCITVVQCFLFLMDSQRVEMQRSMFTMKDYYYYQVTHNRWTFETVLHTINITNGFLCIILYVRA